MTDAPAEKWTPSAEAYERLQKERDSVLESMRALQDRYDALKEETDELIEELRADLAGVQERYQELCVKLVENGGKLR